MYDVAFSPKSDGFITDYIRCGTVPASLFTINRNRHRNLHFDMQFAGGIATRYMSKETLNALTRYIVKRRGQVKRYSL